MNKRPNILVFMTDHQRGDTMFREKGTIMPNLNRLMENGVTFSEAFCPMPHCCPSRATFFSGLYPSEHGVWNNLMNTMALSKGLNSGVRLFSEDLKEAGYNMGYAGKWHVSAEESPANRGFEELHVCGINGEFHGQRWDAIEKLAPSARQDWERGRGEGQMLRRGYSTDILYGRKDDGNAHDNLIAELAAKKIKEYAKDPKPWCLYAGANMPHAPYFVPQKYLDMYPIESVQLPKSFYDTLEDKPNYYRKLRKMCYGQLSELEYRQAIRHFRAMCTYLDDLFGKLMDALRESNQLENTLVLFTSDHGDYAGEHGLFHKGVPAFRGAYHIPAVMSWPAGIKNPGRVVDEMVSMADFAPTFLNAADVQVNYKMTGMSLLPFLRGEKPDWRKAICTQCSGVENLFTQRSIFSRDYRYTYNGFDFDEFYDLKKDPDEMINLIDDPGYEKIKKDLCREMWKFSKQTNDGLPEAGSYIMVSTAAYGPDIIFDE